MRLKARIEFSTESVIQLLSVLLSNKIKKKIIRIGDGDIAMAKHIAVKIKKKFKELVHIEIVNEYGTSLPQNTDTNKRGARDRSSARAIALRSGRIFEPFKSCLYQEMLITRLLIIDTIISAQGRAWL